ncbi:MAG: anaerobic ribonucleoside-triphosphate reductase, partial [Bacilli bacterium]
MDINVKLYLPFVVALNKMKSKYGAEFEKLNSLHNNQLSDTDFIDNFIDSDNVANASIDANANVKQKDICSLEAEMNKPRQKLLSFNKIFYEMTKKYGLKKAEEWLETEWNGGLYLHDGFSASFKPYCFAYDLEDVVNKGLYFVDDFGGGAPKHLTTFIAHVKEFVSWTSNRTSGACGLPSFLVHAYFFWYNDVKNGYYLVSPEYYKNQCFQELIYGLNQPYLRVNQCSFTNISIMDRNYIAEIFGDRKYPNGEYVIDHIEEIMEFQKSFMEVIAKTREEMMFTFPVLTYSLLYQNGKFVDEEFARWCSDHNTKWCDSNFFVGEDVTSLSSCCFDGNTKVLTKSSNGIVLKPIKEIIDGEYGTYRRNLSIFHNGSWVKATPVKSKKKPMYKIITSNNKEIMITEDHILPTISGDILASNLTLNDYVAFNTRKLDSYPEKDNHRTYEQGFVIGLYAGDGSSYIPKNENYSNRIIFSLNETNRKDIETVQKCLNQFNVLTKMNIQKSNELLTVSIISQYLYDFIKDYIKGDYAHEKEFSLSCLYESVEFRKGIIDGWYASDGGNSNRIYSVSPKLIETGEVIFTSLGINTIIDKDERLGEVRFIENNKEYKNNFNVHCIRWYDMKNKRSMENVYKIKNNTEYFKIKTIDKVDIDDEYVYCFNVVNHEPYFTLPNGIISHNCRLVNDFSKLDGFINSIGGTSLKIGSVKVNTINLMRIAYETNSQEEYLEKLKERTHLCIEALDVIRNIIKRNVEKGILPNYSEGLIDIKNQYNTIGINALYETIRHFNFIEEDEFENKSYTQDGIKFASKIMDTINEVKDSYKFDYSINVEAVPAERCAVVLCDKDNRLYPNNNNDFIYANQWIPLTEKCTLDEKIKLGSILDKKCGGGQILHANVDGQFANTNQAWELLNYIASKGVIYFAFNNKISTCKNKHGYYSDICPHCGEPTIDTYQRIVGYLVPSSSYSKERQ